MKQLALSFVVIGIFGIYAYWERTKPNVVVPVLVEKSQPRRFIEDDDDDVQPVVAPPIKTVISNPNLKYRDGVFTGPVTDALYGNLQVKAVITGGKLTDVIFLDYPQDRPTSREINTQAMPYLKSEAIVAQSAQVDVISGATQTSRAFIESLASALNAAI